MGLLSSSLQVRGLWRPVVSRRGGEAELSPDDGCLLPCWGWWASPASSCFPSGSCHIPSLGGGQGEDTTPHLGTRQAPGLLIQETGNPALHPGPAQVPHLPSPENNAGATWGQCQEGPREQNGAGCRPHQPASASVSPGGCRVAGEPSVRKTRVPAAWLRAWALRS